MLSFGRTGLLLFGVVIGGVGVWALAAHRSGSLLFEHTANDVVRSATSKQIAAAPTSSGDRIIGIGTLDVESGVTPLSFPVPGMIDSVTAKEGHKVQKGEKLISLNDGRATSQLAKAESGLREANVRLSLAVREIAAHDLAKRKQEWAIVVARMQKQAADRQLESIRELAGTETLPEEKLRDAKDRSEAFDSALRVEELKLERLKLEDPRTQIQLAEAGVRAAEADVANARKNLQDHTLVAPCDGTVLRVFASLGQLVGQNPLQPALWFVADEPTIVRAEVDQTYATGMSVGMTAELFDDNRQLSLGTGRVIRISPWIAQRRSMLDEPFQRNDVRTLECIVAIESDSSMLRIGQRVRVDFSRSVAKSPATDQAKLAFHP